MVIVERGTWPKTIVEVLTSTVAVYVLQKDSTPHDIKRSNDPRT